MLELTGVSVAAATPFDHVFNSGEVCVVLGGNRSGKTDLLRFVAGLSSRCSGRLILDGVEIGDRARRSAAMVFQAFVNYPNLTVSENIAAPMRERGLAKPEIAAGIQRYAEMLGIDEYLGRLPDELSGGQQQRVAIARALAKEARILVLDEPLVNLDFKLRERLRRELMTLLKELDAIVVYASTDPQDAYALGEQVLIMDGGEKVQAGAPMDVYSKPSSIEAMTITCDPQVNLWTEGAETLAVRPEHCSLTTRSDDDPVASVKFEVFGYEQSGARTLLYGRPTQLECPQDHWSVWLANGQLNCREGEQIDLYMRQADVLRFA